MKWIQKRDANWRIPYEGGWCLKYVREAFGTSSYPRAIDAWNAAQFKHTDYPPAGITVPVYFSLGKEPAGHIAIRLDDLMVASSTQSGKHPKGYLHKNIQDLINVYAKYNGGCKYLGWSEDLGGTRLVAYEKTAEEVKAEQDAIKVIAEQEALQARLAKEKAEADKLAAQKAIEAQKALELAKQAELARVEAEKEVRRLAEEKAKADAINQENLNILQLIFKAIKDIINAILAKKE